MILARQPEDVISLHSLVTDKDILQCVIKGMSHVKLAGNVRRRKNDAVRFFLRIRFIMKNAMIFPILIPTLFNFAWIILVQLLIF